MPFKQKNTILEGTCREQLGQCPYYSCHVLWSIWQYTLSLSYLFSGNRGFCVWMELVPSIIWSQVSVSSPKKFLRCAVPGKCGTSHPARRASNRYRSGTLQWITRKGNWIAHAALTPHKAFWILLPRLGTPHGMLPQRKKVELLDLMLFERITQAGRFCPRHNLHSECRNLGKARAAPRKKAARASPLSSQWCGALYAGAHAGQNDFVPSLIVLDKSRSWSVWDRHYLSNKYQWQEHERTMPWPLPAEFAKLANLLKSRHEERRGTKCKPRTPVLRSCPTRAASVRNRDAVKAHKALSGSWISNYDMGN